MEGSECRRTQGWVHGHKPSRSPCEWGSHHNVFLSGEVTKIGKWSLYEQKGSSDKVAGKGSINTKLVKYCSEIVWK